MRTVAQSLAQYSGVSTSIVVDLVVNLSTYMTAHFRSICLTGRCASGFGLLLAGSVEN